MPSLALLRLIFILSLAGLGAFFPFLAAHLEALGFNGLELGALMAMLPLGRLVAAPLWSAAADRYRMAGTLLRAGCSISALGGILILYASAGTTAALGLLLFAGGRAPLGPIIDSITVRAIPDPRDYGKVRAWGSLGFLGAALIAGALPEAAARALAATLLVATAASAWGVPREGEGGPAPIGPALRALSRQPFLVPLLLTGALQALTLSVYDTFFSAHVRALGLPTIITSFAVALGVAGEIGVMRIARPLLTRFGPARLLQVAALASIPRWLLTGWVDSPVALVLVQSLHALSFAAFWIAGVQAMAHHAPKEIASSAQSLFTAASYGLGALVGAILAGIVRQRLGTPEIFYMLSGVSVLAFASAVWLGRQNDEPPMIRS